LRSVITGHLANLP